MLVPALTVMVACSSVYSRAARDLPPGDRERFDLRVAEARQTAAVADRLLASGRPLLAGETWDESVDDLRWELDRRTESVRDAAARLPGPAPDLGALLSSLDAARADLAALARDRAGPGDPRVGPARSKLGAAVLAADRLSADEEPALAHLPAAPPDTGTSAEPR